MNPRPARLVVHSDDGELVVWESGNPEGSPILFLHGLSFDSQIWQRQMGDPQLGSFRLLATDLRGHGASAVDRSGRYDQARWAADLRLIIDQLALGRLVIVAWSFGAIVLAAYIHAYGEDALVAIHLVAPGTWSGPGFGADLVDPRLTSARATDVAAGVMAFVRDCSQPDPLTHGDDATLTTWVHGTTPVTRRHLLNVTFDYRRLWQTVRTPVLLSFGDSDAVFDRVSASAVADNNAAVTTDVYEHAGHLMFWHESDRFNRELSARCNEAFSHGR